MHKKDESYRFRFIYDPYDVKEKYDISDMYHKYMNDSKAIIEINGRIYYRALCIVRTNIRGRALIATLDSRLNMRVQDIIVDENGREYIVNGFEMYRFAGGIPEWFSNICTVMLVGDIDNTGKYFTKKTAE